MTTNTKKCPYCAEDVNKEAIKCKHCGEFLTKTEIPELSVYEEKPISRTIKYQNLNGAIVISIIVIILSIYDAINYSESERIEGEIRSLLYSSFFSIWLWLSFRKYISNFKAEKIESLIYWFVSLTILVSVLGVFSTIYENQTNEYEWTEDDTFFMFVSIFFLIALISYIITIIKLGNRLIRVKNDFVGSLKQLGVTIIICFPLSLLIGIAGVIYEEDSILLIESIISSIPIIIMITIFSKAKKFMVKEINN